MEMQCKQENGEAMEKKSCKRVHSNDDVVMKRHKPSPLTCLSLKLGRREFSLCHRIMELGDWIVVEMSGVDVIAADIQSRQLLRVNEVDLSGIQHNQVLDLNDEGERWEGDVMNNQPYGWGVFYNSEGDKTYEGFRAGNVGVCYGRSYYPDIQKIEYEGEIFEGKRWGRGIHYDRNGGVIYDGEWLDDEHAERRVEVKDQNQLLHNHIEELLLCPGCKLNCITLDFSLLPYLRGLYVYDNCINNVALVNLTGMHELEKVVINNGSHRDCDKGYFYLKDCERLKELRIGCGSFKNFEIFEIENLPSLEVIEIAASDDDIGCFENASLVLQSGFTGSI